MPPRHGTTTFIEGDLFSFELSKVQERLKTWGAQFQVRDAVCAWSDLLGFGKAFIDSGWKPDTGTWQAIADRLQSAYSIHLSYPSLPDNYILLLNDGVVRTLVAAEDSCFCWPVAFWVRNVVWAHVDVTAAERGKGLPGTRTIITGGQRANYGLPSASFDDFANLATKETPGPTKAAAKAGNPTVASNPAPLQMNTAFSKAYILDDYGSKAGIDGCGLFVDESFFDLLRTHVLASSGRFELVERVHADGLFRAVRDVKSADPNRWIMGFLFALESIAVDVPPLKTTVRRVVKFYPYDESPTEYHVPVPWYPSPKNNAQLLTT